MAFWDSLAYVARVSSASRVLLCASKGESLRQIHSDAAEANAQNVCWGEVDRSVVFKRRPTQKWVLGV